MKTKAFKLSNDILDENNTEDHEENKEQPIQRKTKIHSTKHIINT